MVGIAERYRLNELRETSLRLLVAAEVGQRITPTGSVINRRIADVLVRGARVEIESLAPASAAMLTAVPTALVELAWLQRPTPDAGLDLDAALSAVREQFTEKLPERLLDDIATVAHRDAIRQRERRAAA
jgi:hypothetical protein